MKILRHYKLMIFEIMSIMKCALQITCTWRVDVYLIGQGFVGMCSAHSAHSRVLSLSLCCGWGTWTDGSALTVSRTQRPGEITMMPRPHTRPARRDPPAEDTRRRVETTAASKVGPVMYLCFHHATEPYQI